MSQGREQTGAGKAHAMPAIHGVRARETFDQATAFDPQYLAVEA